MISDSSITKGFDPLTQKATHYRVRVKGKLTERIWKDQDLAIEYIKSLSSELRESCRIVRVTKKGYEI